MNRPVYFDFNATTPIDDRVREAMHPFLTNEFGNASSRSHFYGWTARKAVETARQQVADLVHCEPSQVYFTSGATESNNLVILGVACRFLCGDGPTAHIITTSAEHKAVLDVYRACQRRKWAEVTILDVDEYGLITAEQLRAVMRPNTKLVSVIHGNNEVGSVNPIGELAEVCHKQGVCFHVDGAQTVGKIDLNFKALNVDFLSVSGHKIYGPKGIGALIVRDKNPKSVMDQVMFGGDQEGGVRPGTLNVPGIVGLGVAAQLCAEEMSQERERLGGFQKQIIDEVLGASPIARLNGHPTRRLHNNVSFSFDELDPESFALALSGLALSSGSACNSAGAQGSHVLRAMGHSEALARATVRVGLGRSTTQEHVDLLIQKTVNMIQKS